VVEFLAWSWPLIGGGLIAFGPKLWDFSITFFDPNRKDRLSEQGWHRAGSLETEIQSLRVLLDRCRRRESAKDAVIEILLLALECGEELTEDLASAFIVRAKETLKRSIEKGPGS
jgi:hypothetical protein